MRRDVSRSGQAGSSSLIAAGVRCLSRRWKENHVSGTCKVAFLCYTGLCRNWLFLPKNPGSLSKGVRLLSNSPSCSPVLGPYWSRWSPKSCQQNSLCPGEKELFHVFFLFGDVMTKPKELGWLPLPRCLKALEKGGSCWELSITENLWDRWSKMKSGRSLRHV